MIEEVERRSLDEQLDLEGTEDEFSECGKSKITYTRALLLDFTEAEVCRKLPGDFDLLILSELNGAADGMVGHKRISGNSSILGALPSSRRDTGFPGERWDNHLLMPGKESRSQGNCISERSDVVSQQLPPKSGYESYNAVVLGQNTPKSGLFQLRKSENPYRPPHCNKKLPQPLDTFSELGVQSSGNSPSPAVESDQRGSADSITENDNPRINEVTEMIGANDKLELGIIDDNQPTFEDFWADILESLRLQQEAELKSTPTPDSEVEICLPDEDSLISVDHSIIPKALNFNTLDNNSDDAANSEDEIIWPDEDSLISVYDMIGPNSSMPTLNRDFVEADKVTSNMAVDIRKNLGSLNAKMHSQLSHSQTSIDTFGPEQPFFHLGNGHMSFLTKSNYIPYIPNLNCFNCSNFLYQSCPTNTKSNDSLVQYSLFQQPNIFLKQQNRLLVDTSCRNPIKQVATQDLNAMQYLRLNSQQTTYQGFGKSNAVTLDPAAIGGFVDKKASDFWHAPPC